MISPLNKPLGNFFYTEHNNLILLSRKFRKFAALSLDLFHIKAELLFLYITWIFARVQF